MDHDGERKDGPGPRRRPYEPPSITWDELMPARPGLTLACAKVDATAGSGCEFSAPAS